MLENKYKFEIFKNIGIGLLITSLGVFIGVIYLMSFWFQIGFNIFGYLRPSDFLTSAIFPIYPLISLPLVLFLLYFADIGSMARVKPYLPHCVIFLYIFTILIVCFFLQDLYVNNNVQDKDIYIFIAIFLFAISLSIFIINIFNLGAIRVVLVIICMQGSISMLAGTSFGLMKYYKNNGLVLKNSDICDINGKWIYLNTFGENNIFIENKSKDICVTISKNLILMRDLDRHE